MEPESSFHPEEYPCGLAELSASLVGIESIDDLPILSIPEVNARLPLVRRIVAELKPLAIDVAGRRERLAELRPAGELGTQQRETPYSEELHQMEDDLEADAADLTELAAELVAIGGMVDDPILGRVDFHGRIENADVLFCWEEGENEIAHWHYWGESSHRSSLLERSATDLTSDDSTHD